MKDKEFIIYKLKETIAQNTQIKPKYKNPMDLVEKLEKSYKINPTTTRDEKHYKLHNDYMKYLTPKLKKARHTDYIKWLKGFIQTKGEPTHIYDYNFRNTRWYIAKDNFILASLYGSSALNIIIPENVKYKISNIGHNTVYDMNGYVCYGDFVPIYKNTINVMKRFMSDKNDE
ncbi:MAG: hypothetical protein ACOC1K_08340 [Nanoarchaeota archaeon]